MHQPRHHVTQQVGTALRKLAASGKKGGVTFGGRGFGRLTKTAIGWRTITWQFVATLATSTKCTMQCGHRSTMPTT